MALSFTETSALSVLVQVVGEEKAEELAQRIGGAAFYFPKTIREPRDARIKREFTCLLSTGATCMSSYRQLSKKYRLSPRNVMRIVNHAA